MSAGRRIVATMTEIVVEPADAARFEDVERTLSQGGDGAGCQCQWFTMRNKDFSSSTRDERTELLRDQLGATVSPGLVAYVVGEPAGWVRVGPRPTQARIAHSKRIVAGTQEPLDDESVWAITCFSVPKQFRGRGLMAALLEAAVDHAAAHGARVVEAYPLDPTAAKTPVNDLYLGTLSTFLSHGFTEVARSGANRTVVSRTVG